VPEAEPGLNANSESTLPAALALKAPYRTIWYDLLGGARAAPHGRRGPTRAHGRHHHEQGSQERQKHRGSSRGRARARTPPANFDGTLWPNVTAEAASGPRRAARPTSRDSAATNGGQVTGGESRAIAAGQQAGAFLSRPPPSPPRHPSPRQLQAIRRIRATVAPRLRRYEPLPSTLQRRGARWPGDRTRLLCPTAKL